MARKRVEKLTVEHLLAEAMIVQAQEVLYPNNKTYPKKRLEFEKELIKRLDGDWEEYCRIQGWDIDEV